MQRIYAILDSRFLSRIGNVQTLLGVLAIGFPAVVLLVIAAAGLVDVAGWIPIACFAIWVAFAVLTCVAWATRRKQSTIASPLQQVVIAKGLPGARAALIESIAAAEYRARELIAETAIEWPINNHRVVFDLAEACREVVEEVSVLLAHQDELDHRWILAWERQPSWAGPRMWQPLTKEQLDVVTRYMSLQARRLREMIDFLNGGSDEPVRYAEIWARAEEPAAAPAPA